MGLGEAESLNCGIGIGKNQVPGADFPDGFIKMVNTTILQTFWAPDVSSRELLLEGLLMVDPPVPGYTAGSAKGFLQELFSNTWPGDLAPAGIGGEEPVNDDRCLP